MIHKVELVRCAEHGEASCFQQFTGEHISRHVCTCEKQPPYLCPIDFHSVRYLRDNPEWVEEAPKRHAPPPPKPAPHDCAHRGPKELVTLPDGIRSWLCKACMQELEGRLGEETRPATPIEVSLGTVFLSAKGKKKMEGCRYNSGTESKPEKNCGKICDPGQGLCPRHILVAQADKEREERKEREKRERKQKALADKMKAKQTVRR